MNKKHTTHLAADEATGEASGAEAGARAAEDDCSNPPFRNLITGVRSNFIVIRTMLYFFRM